MKNILFSIFILLLSSCNLNEEYVNIDREHIKEINVPVTEKIDSIIYIDNLSKVDSSVKKLLSDRMLSIEGFKSYDLVNPGESVRHDGSYYLGGLVSDDLYNIHVFVIELNNGLYGIVTYLDNKHNDHEYSSWFKEESMGKGKPSLYVARDVREDSLDVTLDSLLGAYDVSRRNLIYEDSFITTDMKSGQKMRMKELKYLKNVTKYIFIYKLKDGGYSVEFKDKKEL